MVPYFIFVSFCCRLTKLYMLSRSRSTRLGPRLRRKSQGSKGLIKPKLKLRRKLKRLLTG